MSNPTLQAVAQLVLDSVLPLIQGIPALGPVATNLEWNAKKYLGMVKDEVLDDTTFTARLKEDLEKAIGTVGGTGRVATELKAVLAKVSPSEAPLPTGAPVASVSAPTAAPAPVSAPAPTAAPASSSAPVDLTAVLGAAAAKTGESLDWKHSVVDLLKALGQDSSLASRKELAGKLGLDVAQAGSAEGNQALHGALMGALAQSGGTWPSNLA